MPLWLRWDIKISSDFKMPFANVSLKVFMVRCHFCWIAAGDAINIFLITDVLVHVSPSYLLLIKMIISVT